MINIRFRLSLLCQFCLFIGYVSAPLISQQSYQLPPKEIVDIIDAPPTPNIVFSPNGEHLLIVERSAMPSIEDLSRRMLKLAGLRIDPAANARFNVNFNRALSIRATDGSDVRRVAIPDEAKISSVSWSHRSHAFVVTTVTDQGSQLWWVDVENPSEPKRIVENLNSVTVGVNWMPDGESLICATIPVEQGTEPPAPRQPLGPNIQESFGFETPTRTYQDLLKDPYDEALFDFYFTTQLAIVNREGAKSMIGRPAIFGSLSVSPNGDYLLVATIQRPYSYLLPMSSFPTHWEVWSLRGELVYKVAEVPLEENIPIEGVRQGRRSISWRSNEPATLSWVEALDGGDPRNQVDHRDQLFMLAAPFDTSPREVAKLEHRFVGSTDMLDRSLLITTELDRDRRWIRSLLHSLDSLKDPITLVDRSLRDRYGDPGQLAMRELENGQRVVRQDGDWVYRIGLGASPQGNLPFIDRFNLATLETERLWRCQEGTYEMVVDIRHSGADTKPTVVTVKESLESPSNFFQIDLNDMSTVALTDFPDPLPQIRGIQRELVQYERADGVQLSATMYLPEDYQPGTRLPLLIWAYPIEFNDPQTAGQVSDSPWRFTRMGGISHLTLVKQGYAVMDNATMPVIGDPETMNDTFVEQIVAAAQAAIDKAVDMGVADRDRVAVGGHSYGAFMTANLLAHSDLFKAGIARSGAYNRTLTPFGFQAERRKFWDAKDVYMNVSPFTHADKIRTPILLIHGEDDNNSGTFPVQSLRMFQAIKGNGGNVRLVMLPYESHGYQARESVLHTQAEMLNWLDKFLK
ncbi:MAG TPA: prolyl oligopeptidase family serine peptidase [Pirellulaceae bacterium]|nr:prolyl oligopeptidase family serine peptidase [Pirellulaceae bacterium]HMO91712.1 prolyl oligopeptidase family serine peptidase [Pirellulaceae bacterium]HMP69825.1 prolyl oligopeptidase family serine peptidase [Pirellulaceae bacterium]